MSFDIQSIYTKYLVNPYYSFADDYLKFKYRSLVNLNNMYTVSNGTIITNNVSILSNLNVLGNSFGNG